MSRISSPKRRSLRPASRATLSTAGFVLLTLALSGPAAAQVTDPLGKETYPQSMALADQLALSQPATAWETTLDGEAADLIEFLDDDRLLVGVAEVDKHGAPKHGRLHLFDLSAGQELWRVGRRDVGTGGYELLAREPWLLLRASDGEETRITALDEASGDREWELTLEDPSTLAFLPDEERVLVVDRRDDRSRLRAVRLSDGRDDWTDDVPESLVALSTPVSLMVSDERVLLVGRGVAVVDAEAGTVGTVAAVPTLTADAGSVLALGRELVSWDAHSVASVDPVSGTVPWTWDADGEIQTVSTVDGDVLVVVGSDDRATVIRLESEAGARRWSADLEGSLTGPIALDSGLVVVPTESALVALSIDSGDERFRTALPEAVVAGSPTESELVGMPDVLRVEGNTLYMAREQAGLLSFRMPSGELAWYRPHHEAPGTPGRYTGEGRFGVILAAQMMQSGGLPETLEAPAGLGIGSGASSLLAAAQRDYETARGRYDALDRDASSSDRGAASSSVRMATELGIAATQLDIGMGQLSAAADFARSILSVRDAIRAYNVAKGLQAQVDRAELSMRSTLLMQQQLFQGEMYVRPFVMAGKGRGASLIRLGTGLRTDPIFSPVNGPSLGYGLDLGIVRVSPSGARMAVVGISLERDRWERRDKWDTHLPPMSLLTYRVGDLEFGEEARYPYSLTEVILDGADAVRQALAGGTDPDGEPQNRPLHMAVLTGKLDVVRVLLEAGADPNAPDTGGSTAIQQTRAPEMIEVLLAAGAEEKEDGGVNIQTMTSPLFVGASTQNEEMIRQAIADGANPNMMLDQGQSILYLAVALDNADLVRVLIELGATPEWEDDNGDTPLDLAGSDAVREVLRRAAGGGG